MEEQSRENKPKPYNSFIKYSGLAIQMGVTIYLGSVLGNFLDSKYDDHTGLYTKICTLLAVFLAMISVIRQVTRHQD